VQIETQTTLLSGVGLLARLFSLFHEFVAIAADTLQYIPLIIISFNVVFHSHKLFVKFFHQNEKK